MLYSMSLKVLSSVVVAATSLTVPAVLHEQSEQPAQPTQPAKPRPADPQPVPSRPGQTPRTPDPRTPPTDPNQPADPNQPNDPNRPGNPNQPGQTPGQDIPADQRDGDRQNRQMRPFQFQSPQDEGAFGETTKRLQRQEQRLEQRGQELLTRLGEVRRLDGDRQNEALMQLIQQMLMEQKELRTYLVASRTAWSGELDALDDTQPGQPNDGQPSQPNDRSPGQRSPATTPPR